jgi:hypothetical protein
MSGNKQICIVDTDSLLFAFRLELRPEKAIQKISRRFDLIIPEKVVEEYADKTKRRLLREYDDVKQDIDLFLERRKDDGKIVKNDVYSHCLQYAERWFNLVGKQEEYKNKIDEGERHCMALGLFLSRKNEQCLYLVTDDFTAIDAGIRLFVKKQRIGLVYSLPELIILNYLLDRGIPELNVRAFINDYFIFNKPQSAEFLDLKTKFLEEIEMSCRKQFSSSCNICCKL